MVKGLYTSALGMTTQMDRLDIISNNIANVDTTAFKRDIAVTRSFSEELLDRLNDEDSPLSLKLVSSAKPVSVSGVSLGVFVDEVSTDFRPGNFTTTGAPLDLAINGSGFFAIQSQDGVERYTRDGSFMQAQDGTLTTSDGGFVLGQNGVIRQPLRDNIVIDSTGAIQQRGRTVARLRIVDFQNPETLRKVGNNMYETTAQSTAAPFAGSVVSGALEASNVSAVSEMAEMITVTRIYETNQKILSMIDSTMEQAATRIAARV